MLVQICDKNWRPIPNFPDYIISDNGTILSKIFRNGRTEKPREYPKIIKQFISIHGYPRVMLNSKSRKGKNFPVHRLVLEAFVGPCPEGKECDHINGVKTDNRLSNLRYITKSKNLNRRKLPNSEKSYQATVTNYQAKLIRSIVKSGAVQNQLSKLTGISTHTINKIIKGKTYKEAL